MPTAPLWPLRHLRGQLLASCSARASLPPALQELFEASLQLGREAKRVKEPVALVAREAVKEELRTCLELKPRAMGQV